MDPREFVKTEWRAVISSKTFAAICTVEGGAIIAFVKGVFSGTQELSLDALKLWALLQAALVIVICVRHTMAGTEAKLDVLLGKDRVDSIKRAAQKEFLEILQSKGHGEAAKVVSLALNTPTPNETQPEGSGGFGGSPPPPPS